MKNQEGKTSESKKPSIPVESERLQLTKIWLDFVSNIVKEFRQIAECAVKYLELRQMSSSNETQTSES